jgi:hypothetical protein
MLAEANRPQIDWAKYTNVSMGVKETSFYNLPDLATACNCCFGIRI